MCPEAYFLVDSRSCKLKTKINYPMSTLFPFVSDKDCVKLVWEIEVICMFKYFGNYYSIFVTLYEDQ